MTKVLIDNVRTDLMTQAESLDKVSPTMVSKYLLSLLVEQETYKKDSF